MVAKAKVSGERNGLCSVQGRESPTAGFLSCRQRITHLKRASPSLELGSAQASLPEQQRVRRETARS